MPQHLPLYPGNWAPLNELLARLDGIVVDVKDPQFSGGAVGNGVIDDTAAIQAALDSAAAASFGAAVVFPAGSYLISAPLTYKSSNTKQLTMMGAGMSSSIITQKSATADVMLKSGDNATQQLYLLIQDLGFTSFNNQTANTGGLLLEKTGLSRLNRVLVSYCNNYLVKVLGGGAPGDAQDNAITDCWFGNVLANKATTFQVYLASSASAGGSAPDGMVIRGSVFTSTVGTAVKTDKGSITRGYGPDFVMQNCSVQTTPVWYDVDGNAVKVIGNRFEVSSGTGTINIAATAKSGIRVGNSLAAPGGLAINDLSPVGTTDEWIVADNHGSNGGTVSRGVHNYDELGMIAEGFIAQTASRKAIWGTSTTTAGTLRLASVYLRKGMVLSNGWVSVATNGTGVTLAKVGVWNTSGTLQVATADMSAGINAGTPPRGQSGAFTPFTVTADGNYWLGIVQVGGTPAIIGEVGSNNSGSWSASGVLLSTAALSGQTDAVTFNPASLVANGTIPWIGVN